VHGDVSTEVVPGNTTNVTYKCNDPFVLDPNGPQNSVCDELTGQWSELPRCICPDPLVPTNAEVAQRVPYSVRFRCAFLYHLIGEDIVTCDEIGAWGHLPSCNFTNNFFEK
jgi:hypothetical protein